MGGCSSAEIIPELKEAIEEKDLPKVKKLLPDMEDINALEFEDPTFGSCAAIHLATKSGDWDIVLHCLQAGADQFLESSRGLTALTAALVSGQEDIGFKLLTQTKGVKDVADMNRENSKGLTPLLIAILYKREMSLEMLIRMEADLTRISSKGGTKGLTALLVAIHKQFQEAVELLIEGGAPLDAKSNMSQSPLVFAAERNNVPAVISLINGGADPEGLQVAFNDENISLWTWAARNAYQEVLDILPAEKIDYAS